MIYLDGSYLEGGGQIIRTALALSALTKKAFEIENIRKGRCNSGLAHQHIQCVKSVKEICNAYVEGHSLGSEKIQFIPLELKTKNMNVDIGTAGSITLLLQALLLPCMFGDRNIKLKLTGGTDVKWSQPFDYFNNVLIPQIKRFCDINVHLIKRGYYPKGNGSVEISIKPLYKIVKKEFIKELQQNFTPLNLINQGNLIYIKGVSHASSDLQKAHVAERQAETAELLLKQYGTVDIRTEYSETLSTGSGITVWAIYSKDKDEIDFRNPIRLGADSLGEKGKKAEMVGTEAAERLINEMKSNAPIDQYLGDQILPFLALVKGQVKVSHITNHCKTNMYVIEKFLGTKFEINENIISVK